MPIFSPSPTAGGDPVVELRELRAGLLSASERAAAALHAGLPGCQPGESLRRFLIADAEVAAIARRIKRFQDHE
jgi:hypothetical protein